MAEPFPLVEVLGRPFERGLIHGRMARERVRGSVALYAGRLDALGLDAAAIRELAEGYLRAMTAFSPDHVEEMRGIAEGAGTELAEIVLVNARTEIFQLGKRRSAKATARGRESRAGEGCTTVVVAPARSPATASTAPASPSAATTYAATATSRASARPSR